MSWWREDVLAAIACSRLSVAPIVRRRRDQALMRLKITSKGPLAAIVFAIAAIVTLPAFGADNDIADRATVCAGCHGQDGKPVTPATPIIWGQQASYLYKDLHDYHSGARSNETMSSIAQSFSLEDLRSLANYFAAKTWPAAPATAAPTPPEGIAMCKACHGQNFEGGAPAPRLAGLDYTYLISAMNGFADGTRTNNLDMPGFMKALTVSQREAIAHYLAAL